ncbi:MAG: hypothetical protein Q9163_004123 [Psora crenata]
MPDHRRRFPLIDLSIFGPKGRANGALFSATQQRLAFDTYNGTVAREPNIHLSSAEDDTDSEASTAEGKSEVSTLTVTHSSADSMSLGNEGSDSKDNPDTPYPPTEASPARSVRLGSRRRLVAVGQRDRRNVARPKAKVGKVASSSPDTPKKRGRPIKRKANEPLRKKRRPSPLSSEEPESESDSSNLPRSPIDKAKVGKVASSSPDTPKKRGRPIRRKANEPLRKKRRPSPLSSEEPKSESDSSTLSSRRMDLRT